MSDLDKAIRAAADEANWFGLHHALTAVLNELNSWDRDVPVFADRLRRVIAEPLGVSGEDRSEPTPAPREPRVWPTTVTVEPDSVRVVCDDEGDQWERDEDGLWYSDSAASPWPWAALMHEFGPLTEVDPPKGTS